jgi:type IV pilus assembly protein PilB
MVLSTLHTNDAPSTLARLINMGIPSYNVAASVNLITAQRLGRRLCPNCRKPVDIPPEALLNAGFSEADLDGSWQAYTAGGCPNCKDTGYKGRVGIYQVMSVSEEIVRIILKNGSAADIAEQAHLEGVLNLREAGLLKVKQGQTSLEEVLAVTNE